MTIRSTLPGGDQSALRHLNTRRVLEALYDGPPLTISGVARVTGLSRPTAQAILASLTDSGLLRPDGHDMIKTGGRPAQRYRFNAAAGLLAGIDIGAHAVAVRIADLNGVLQTGVRRAVPADLPAGERLQTALTLLDQALPHQTARLWAAGVGTPGIVDSGGAVRLSVAVPGWTGVRLAEEIGRRLDCPVAAMKDANLAVLAEHRHGTGRDVSHVLYVHVGHRLGVGPCSSTATPSPAAPARQARSAAIPSSAGRRRPRDFWPRRAQAPSKRSSPAPGRASRGR
ncbi:ROK family transcriptional regulator [Nonomuraea dietziae]|uniref:ROK family transcriptional regulator n=1 Tax=Nonomuraea dietziae TaxID=65515 RepID=UPI0031D0817B